MTRALALAVALSLIVTSAAGGTAQLPEKVRYSTQDGMSSWQSTGVTFASGSELNTATTSYDYDASSVSAVVFFIQHQAAVIKLQTFLACGPTVTGECIQPSIMNPKGADKEGRRWEICTGSWCF